MHIFMYSNQYAIFQENFLRTNITPTRIQLIKNVYTKKKVAQAQTKTRQPKLQTISIKQGKTHIFRQLTNRTLKKLFYKNLLATLLLSNQQTIN